MRRSLLDVIAGDGSARRDDRGRCRCPTTRAALTGDVRGVRIGVPRASARGRRRSRPCSTAFEQRRSPSCRPRARRSATSQLPHAAMAIPVYYLVAHRRSELQPRALRRRPLRIARRRPRHVRRDVRPHARRRFGAEVKRRIMIGTYVLSAGLLRRLLSEGAADSHADSARLRRGLRARGCRRLADHADARRSSSASAPTIRCRCTCRTSSPSARPLAGLPAISIPCGLTPGAPAGRPAVDDKSVRRSDAPARRRRHRAPRGVVERATAGLCRVTTP